MATKDEKTDHLLPTAVLLQAPRPRRFKWRAFGFVALLASALSVASRYVGPHSEQSSFAVQPSQFRVADTCPQSNTLYPGEHAQLWKNLGHNFDEDAFTTKAVEWLAGAVRIRYVFMNTSCDVSPFFNENPVPNKGRRHSTTWVSSVKMSGGRSSGRCMTTSLMNFHSRAPMITPPNKQS